MYRSGRFRKGPGKLQLPGGLVFCALQSKVEKGQPCWLDTPAKVTRLQSGAAPSDGQHPPLSASLMEVFELPHRHGRGRWRWRDLLPRDLNPQTPSRQSLKALAEKLGLLHVECGLRGKVHGYGSCSAKATAAAPRWQAHDSGTISASCMMRLPLSTTSNG